MTQLDPSARTRICLATGNQTKVLVCRHCAAKFRFLIGGWMYIDPGAVMKRLIQNVLVTFRHPGTSIQGNVLGFTSSTVTFVSRRNVQGFYIYPVPEVDVL